MINWFYCNQPRKEIDSSVNTHVEKTKIHELILLRKIFRFQFFVFSILDMNNPTVF